jgi:hypothetical protein
VGEYTDRNVFATRGGRVIRVGWAHPGDGGDGFGYRILLKAPDGAEEVYSRMEPGSVLYRAGERVAAGSHLGRDADLTNGSAGMPLARDDVVDAGDDRAALGDSSRADGEALFVQPEVTALSQFGPDQGVPVVLPNGRNVRDPYVGTGVLMSPSADLSAVAAAGHRVGVEYQNMLSSSLDSPRAETFLAAQLFRYLAQGGAFDYQRSGNQLVGLATGGRTFTRLRQFRNVSNFNVGLFSQQAGLSLERTLRTAGEYAARFSGNYRPEEPYGLHPRTAEFIRVGFQVGRTGLFDLPATPP